MKSYFVSPFWFVLTRAILIPSINAFSQISRSLLTWQTSTQRQYMVSAVEHLVGEQRRLIFPQQRGGITVLVDNYSDDSRRSECFEFKVTEVTHNLLQQQLELAKQQYLAQQERINQLEKELLVERPRLVYEKGLDQLRKHRIDLDSFLREQKVEERHNISSKHELLLKMVTENHGQIDQMKEELEELRSEILEMQCEAVRFPVRVNHVLAAIRTEQIERCINQNESNQMLQNKAKQYELWLGRTLMIRREWLAHVTKTYKEQLQESESAWFDNQEATRNAKLEIRNLDLRISALLQERSCLHVMLKATLLLLCKRLWQITVATVLYLARQCDRYIIQQPTVQRRIQRMQQYCSRQSLKYALSPARIMATIWSVIYFFVRQWESYWPALRHKLVRTGRYALTKLGQMLKMLHPTTSIPPEGTAKDGIGTQRENQG